MSDSSSVLLWKGSQADADGRHTYFYAPSRLRIVESDGGRPAILYYGGSVQGMMAANDRPVARRSTGGVLHLIVDWTLSDAEVQAAERELARRCGGNVEAPPAADASAASTTRPPVRDGFAPLRMFHGVSVEEGKIPCGDIDGPLLLAEEGRHPNLRLKWGPSFDGQNSRVSTGRLKMLPGRKMSIVVELDTLVTRRLGNRRTDLGDLPTPGGGWRLDLQMRIPASSPDRETRSDVGLHAAYDIRPWLEHVRRRGIAVHVDDLDTLKGDFGSVVDHVTVLFRKEVGGSTVSHGSVVLDEFSAALEIPGFEYRNTTGSLADWLSYHYRIIWNFAPGGRHDTGWVETNDPLIRMEVPYEHRTVELVAEPGKLRQQDVQSVTVDISGDFFGDTRRIQRVFELDRPERQSIEELAETVEILLPRGQHAYQYHLTWHVSGRDDITASGTDDDGLIFIDELPTGEVGE